MKDVGFLFSSFNFEQKASQTFNKNKKLLVRKRKTYLQRKA
jgi:hypothetical protein